MHTAADDAALQAKQMNGLVLEKRTRPFCRIPCAKAFEDAHMSVIREITSAYDLARE